MLSWASHTLLVKLSASRTLAARACVNRPMLCPSLAWVEVRRALRNFTNLCPARTLGDIASLQASKLCSEFGSNWPLM